MGNTQLQNIGFSLLIFTLFFQTDKNYGNMVYGNLGQILGISKEPVAFCNDPSLMFEPGDTVQLRHKSRRQGIIRKISDDHKTIHVTFVSY